MFPKNLFRRPRNQLEDQTGATDSAPGSVCPACRAMLAQDALAQNLDVCPQCGHHFRLGARRRLELLLDEGSFCETDAALCAGDPLDFPGYAEKIATARSASGENEGVITGVGAIGKARCALFSMEPSFMMGSMGTVVGEKITRLFEYATREKLPVVGFTVSGGARMQEGALSLMQMAKTSGAVARHGAAGLLYIAVLTDPTTGGVMASFAMQGDIAIAEPGALIGFAGPRVIEQTIRQKLPEGFQRAEFLLEKGFVDLICDRRDLRERLLCLLRLHAGEEAS